LPRGGARGEQTYKGEGFRGKVQSGGSVRVKKPIRWKTSLILGKLRAENARLSGAPHFGTSPILG
jgi:hypothetical protein